MGPLPETHEVQPKKVSVIKAKIMIVDDDLELLEELSTALSANNYEVESVSNSEIAFDIACKVKPDLVITDLKMRPKNGFMLVDELQNSYITKSIPIIAITGFFTEKEHFVMMKMAGMKYALTKPVNPEELLLKIESILKENKESSSRQ
jgi:DNA-binding response OmpR family regulator